MRSLVRLATTLAVSAACAAVSAQPPAVDELHVGNSRIDPGVLKPYRVQLKETIVSIQNLVLERARWTDELEKTVVDGKEAWHRHIEVVTPAGAFRETVDLLVDAATFAPLRTFERNNTGSMTFTFARDSLRGERKLDAEPAVRRIDAQVGAPFFDYYGGMMELFLVTLPFKAGYRATFPAAMATTDANADPTKIDWPIVEMKGEETIAVGSTTYRAWRAEVNTPYGFYRIWVRKEPPFFVRTILLIPPGGRIVYDLVPDPTRTAGA